MKAERQLKLLLQSSLHVVFCFRSLSLATQSSRFRIIRRSIPFHDEELILLQHLEGVVVLPGGGVK